MRIKFLPDAARIVTETQWHATQKATPTPDGCVVLSFQIDGLEEICNWLLGWSGRAEVLEPTQLRKMVQDFIDSFPCDVVDAGAFSDCEDLLASIREDRDLLCPTQW